MDGLFSLLFVIAFVYLFVKKREANDSAASGRKYKPPVNTERVNDAARRISDRLSGDPEPDEFSPVEMSAETPASSQPVNMSGEYDAGSGSRSCPADVPSSSELRQRQRMYKTVDSRTNGSDPEWTGPIGKIHSKNHGVEW